MQRELWQASYPDALAKIEKNCRDEVGCNASSVCFARIFIDKPLILFYYHFYSLKLNG
jgi:hypothetical protein